jgi:hypothetical protein
VVPLLDRLPVEEGSEPGQRLGVVVDGRPDVLLGGGELVRDLLVEGVGEALVGHGRSLSGCPFDQACHRNPVSLVAGGSGLAGSPGSVPAML